MVLIFITCAVINHLFFTLWSMSVMHFLSIFFFFLMIRALFTLRKRLRIRSVISVNYHYITVLCP